MTTHKKLSARILSMALSLAMVFTMLPMQAFATTGGDITIGTSSVQDSGTPKLCESHTAHDEACNYIEAVEATLCAHLNEDGNYSCAPVSDSDSVSENIASPSEASYACDHNDDCGYAEAIEGADCTHTCEKCTVVEQPTQSEAVTNVLALITALPTMADIEAQNPEGAEFPEYLAKLRTNIANARTAYDALTAEEKVAFDADVLAKLTALEDVLAGVSAATPMTISSGTVTMPWGQNFEVNQETKDATTQIWYGNNKWLVIGAKGTGVASASGDMTLFANDNIGGTVKFDAADPYTNNYGTNSSTAQSNLKTEIDELTATGTGLFSANEIGAISAVTLPGGATNTAQDGMYGDDVTNALLWPLDVAEAKSVGRDVRISSSSTWWLRSPGFYGGIEAAVVHFGGSVGSGGDNVYDHDYGVRPAFKLNLNSVLFASAAVGGKSGTAGATLSAAVQPTGEQKLTVLDSTGQTVTIGSTIQSGSTVTINYSGATTGTGQNISAIMKDATGKIKYYGKIADTSSNTSGTATVTIPSDFAVGWTLEVFSEQVNGDKFTDYASTPVTVNAAPPTKYAVTATAGTGGSISPTGTEMVNNGESQIFTISANSNYSIASVTVDGVNQGAIGTYTFSNVTSNHTISATFSYNGGSGGGSSSGGGGGSSSGGGGGGSTTTPPTKTTEPVTGTSNTSANVDNKGNATVNITEKNISDAVKAAQDVANKKGVNAGEVTAVINVTSPTNSNPNTVSVNLPKTVQEQVISSKIGNLVIVVDKPDISIGMNLATVTEMNKQAKADIQISATRTDATTLSTEAKNAIGSRPAFDLKASYANGSKSVTNFGTGTVSVAIPYTLQNGEIAGGLYAVYVDGNGKVNYITNSSYDADKKVLRFSTNHFSVYGISYKAPIAFTDIANHWAKTDIEFVANRDLMNGTSSTTFAPNGAMTRAMFVTALGRLAGVDVNGYKTGKFTDVKADVYYAPYVNWAAEKGIVKGITATTFAPDQAITRQEMATIMSSYAKALGYQVPETRAAVTYADNGSIASWAAPAVKQMQMAGILNGKDGNRFDPTGTATRGEISAMLHRYVELVIDRTTAEGFTTNDSGSAMYYQDGKALTGNRTVGGKSYSFNAYGETALLASTAAQPLS